MPVSDAPAANRRRLLAFAVPALAALLVGGGFFLWQHGATPASQQPAPAVTAAANRAGQPAAGNAQANHAQTVSFHTGLEHLPASLAGTRVPDGLHVDSQGNLVVSEALRDVFDYFLSTLGEEDQATVIQRLRAYLANNLTGKAAQQAQHILDGYLAWRDNLATMPRIAASDARVDLDAIKAQQHAVQASCPQYLDDTVCRAFFGREARRNRYALDRLTVMRDDSLSATQKAARVAALTAELPATMQNEISDLDRYRVLQQLTRQNRQEGKGRGELRQIREQLVGPAAADRLEKLDQQRQQFKQRLAHWLTQRAALLHNTGLSRADRQAQVAALRQQAFTAQEIVRVKARERIADHAHRNG
ncbi:MAG: lipase secretion chaperone [Alcanivorax sp.]|nr:lipase secretion chaperone [Alcanivorax sp.]